MIRCWCISVMTKLCVLNTSSYPKSVRPVIPTALCPVTPASSIVSHHRHFSWLAVLSISWLWKLALQKPEMISNCIVKFVALVPEYNHPYGQRIFGFWVLGCYWHHSVYTIFLKHRMSEPDPLNCGYRVSGADYTGVEPPCLVCHELLRIIRVVLRINGIWTKFAFFSFPEIISAFCKINLGQVIIANTR